jgi:hypothetical protein
MEFYDSNIEWNKPGGGNAREGWQRSAKDTYPKF